jgi:hypothetical protein
MMGDFFTVHAKETSGQTLEPTAVKERAVRRKTTALQEAFKSQRAVQKQVQFQLRESSSSWSSGA